MARPNEAGQDFANLCATLEKHRATVVTAENFPVDTGGDDARPHRCRQPSGTMPVREDEVFLAIEAGL